MIDDNTDDQYLQLPIDPREATDLQMHVANCVKRHVALVSLIHRQEKRQMKSNVITWVYRAITIPLLIFIAVQFVFIQRALLNASISIN
jgi:hypothetical protein